MSEELNLNPPRFLLSGRGGNDLSVLIQLGYNASTGVHTIYFAETPTGTAIETYTDGAGLTLEQDVDDNTETSFTLPRALTAEYVNKSLFLQYDLVMGGILRTQMTAKIDLQGGISAS